MDVLEELKLEIDNFAEERDWSKFHSPVNLAKSISIEANELLECFQWSDDNFLIDEVKDELADVLNYAILMASVMNLDIRSIVLEKMKKNSDKYPTHKAKGKSDKYTKL